VEEGSEVLTIMIMKSSLFWDIILCNPLKLNQYFRGTCSLLQVGFLFSISFNPEDGGNMFLQNVG
jgi:hypothetical protein